MDTRWEQIWDIFFKALELKGELRQALLVENCGEDAELRREVEELLIANEQGTNPLDVPIISNEPGPALGDEINGYRLLRVLGEGGMGVVFEAQQVQPIERRVALKLIKPGMDTRNVLLRFAMERQTLALMNHPGIAQVFDAGISPQGRPYFVMELVSGMPVTRWCDDQKLTLFQRIEVFRAICSAVQHAHQKGIIHRDLKPSNILIAASDDQPQPKIIDFGIARALHRTTGPAGITRIGDFVGTPEYMSPEQAGINNLDLDTRTDIYSLGVVLYVLLTGTLPFNAETLGTSDYAELQRILREQEPSPPSTQLKKLGDNVEEIAARRGLDPKQLIKALSGDLDWIVLKAMDKDRTRRYDTVSEFSADLGNFVNQRTVTAHPPGKAYRMRKFVARHKVSVTAAAAIAVALIAAVIGITMGLVVAERERHRAETVSHFLQDMLVASKPENAQGRDTSYIKEVLANASQRVDKELKDQPEAAASLHYTIAGTYRSLGLYDEAAEHFVTALQLQRKYLGSDHELTLETLSMFATLRWEQGKYKEAEALARETLAGQDRIYPKNDDRRLSTLNTLGLVLKTTGRYAEAENLYREVMDIRRQTLGIGNVSTIISQSNLARLLEERGKLDEAVKLMREVVEVGLSVQGEDDPETLVSLDILGVMLRKQGKLAEAETYHRRALAGSRKVLGDDHEDTLGVRLNLARLLMAQEKLAEAESELRQTLDIVSHKYGENTFYTFATARSLGDCLLKENQPKEAETVYKRALAAGSAILPPEHDLLAAVTSKQAAALIALGDYRAAEPLLLKSYPALLKSKGEQDPDTVAARNNLIALYDHTNRPDQANRYRSAQ